MTEGQLSEILTSLPTRISDVVKPWAERSPDRPALVEDTRSWTYGQLDSIVAETLAWLHDSGVRPGDRVMIVCENCRAFVAVLLGLAGLDAWPVLVSARLSPRELDDIRDHCGARRVLYTTSVSPHATAHAKRHGAIIEEVLNLGPIGVGPLNEKVRAEPIEHSGGLAVAAVASTQIDAVPPPVRCPDPSVRRRSRTVEERLAHIEAAVSVRVAVWLLQREPVWAVERMGGVAVGRIGGRARRERGCDVALRRTHEEGRGFFVGRVRAGCDPCTARRRDEGHDHEQPNRAVHGVLPPSVLRSYADDRFAVARMVPLLSGHDRWHRRGDDHDDRQRW